MRDRLIELLRDTFNYTRGVCIDFDEAVEINADHLFANGVIVMPCKVGDTLYVNFQYLRSWENKTYPVTVNAIRLDTKKNNHRICVNGTFHLREDYSHNYMATFNFDNIGKTIFRTREEAEAKLKEHKND